MEQFKIGQRVRVSSGTPRPPQHHRRKLAIWNNANFEGTVTEYRESCALYNGGPAVHVEHDASGLKSLDIASFVSVVPASRVTAVRDAA